MTTTTAATDEDLRPQVGRAVSNRGVWLFGGGLAVAAILLFVALESRRAEVISPATTPGRDAAAGIIAPPPALALPGGDPETGLFTYGGVPRSPLVPSFAPQMLPVVPITPRVLPVVPVAPTMRAPQFYDPESPDPVYRPTVPTVVVPLPDSNEPGVATAVGTTARLAGGRVAATRFSNPALTVPQGTVIQAVLETALDSNRPGFVRAIVSRDVRSFDGSKVLIPRGSRLFGEYKADLADGQNRAFVTWQKLTRPDGVQIALESPAADPLGRAGIKGKVNTHFFTRFANALLQSALDIGVGVATRSATGGDTVVLGLPGSQQTVINPQSQSIRPTLSVRQGSSVSVFVARDLDFSTVE
ncbi:MAG: TrbI/VirB10 family protein [Novosphingobium sp.]